MNTPVKTGKRLLAALMLAAPLVVPQALLAAAPQPAAVQGPIDIQANEQEFAADSVIARGNVHVKYKDSTVIAPEAQLFRDPSGNPQRAVFTGHPHLLQGLNKIDAEKLTFEVATSKVIAEGHAHSEVVNQADDQTGGANKPDQSKAGAGGKPGTTATAGKPAPAKPGSTAPSAAGADAYDPDAPEAIGAPASSQPASTKGSPSAAAAVNPGALDKIITDSDRQEYERSSGRFEAAGHVRVVHDDILVKADHLQLVYGLDNKPETALFSGHVAATQNRNTTLADKMVYSLSTRRLQATGHVKSTVIQEQKPEPKKNAVSFDPVGMPAATAAETFDAPEDDVVVITSNTQDYSKDTNRMTANGNVRVYYQDMVGAGPAAVLIRNAQNKAERIIFSGRSQISQPTKRWIADHIEMTVADKKIIASGNTKAIILQAPQKQSAPPPSNTQLAGSNRSTISATKVEATR